MGIEMEGATNQADHLDAPLIELILKLGKSAEFGGADGGEVGRVREENGPAVANEFVEIDLAVGGGCLEIRSYSILGHNLTPTSRWITGSIPVDPRRILGCSCGTVARNRRERGCEKAWVRGSLGAKVTLVEEARGRAVKTRRPARGIKEAIVIDGARRCQEAEMRVSDGGNATDRVTSCIPLVVLRAPGSKHTYGDNNISASLWRDIPLLSAGCLLVCF